ncbi:aerobic cobaltochelatase subunit, putative [Babesia ovata]|uniref:Aerobic cobaltochelatase subunit, putative n=1 Tax=Babesia ovata TaxID=189622 RepID=A0A2H6K9J4_9APIC|nr:aerobic cobaltochelatase subunit, putative [Babesia ovata]GBE59661.1 aerobic cobaltochelatase subunit, putative [Babesia ovata]
MTRQTAGPARSPPSSRKVSRRRARTPRCPPRVALDLDAVLHLGFAGGLNEPGVEVPRHHPVGAHVDGLHDVTAHTAATISDYYLVSCAGALPDSGQLPVARAEAGASRGATDVTRTKAHFRGVGTPALQVTHALRSGYISSNDKGLVSEVGAHEGDHLAHGLDVAVGDVNGEVLGDQVRCLELLNHLVGVRLDPDGDGDEELELAHLAGELHGVDVEPVHDVEVVAFRKLDGDVLVNDRRHVGSHERDAEPAFSQLSRHVGHGAALQHTLAGYQHDILEVKDFHFKVQSNQYSNRHGRCDS